MAIIDDPTQKGTPMLHRISISICFISLVFTATLHGQERGKDGSPLQIGLSVRGTMDLHSGAMEHFGFLFPVLQTEPESRVLYDNTGNGLGYSTGIVLEYQLSESFSLRSHILYTMSHTRWEQQLPGKKLLSPTTHAVSELYNVAIAEFDQEGLETDIMGVFKPSNAIAGLGLSIGGVITIPLSSKESRRVELGPNGGLVIGENDPDFSDLFTYYPDSVYSVNNPVERASSPLLAVRAGVSYDVPFSESITIRPNVSATFGLTPIVKDSEWRSSIFSLGIDLITQW